MISSLLAQATSAAEKTPASSPPFDVNALMTKLAELGAEYGLKLLAAIAIYIIGRFVARVIVRVVEKVLKGRDIDQAVISFTTNVVSVGLTVFIVIAVLGQLGVRTTSLVAVIGAAGLAIGLAMQGSLSNFAAGFLIIAFKPFKNGDFIEANGVSGVIEHIYIFTSELRTPDNKVVIIPNAKLTDDNIINYTSAGQRRIDMIIGIAYDASIDEARKIIQDILAKDDRILADPEPLIGVAELGDSSVNLAVRPWVRVEDYWAVYFDTQEAVKKRFDEDGIGIPFPQRDVHLYQQTA